jgi:very-short-patch-repair endonuclease
MLASSMEAAGSIIARWLALHERRRHHGLPTASVLAGPLGLSISCLRDWALRHHRLLAVFEPESPPETTGLFRLRAPLGFRFGSSRAVEVDLAADSLYLVVEIDGYYHFQDPCSYHRDRRKEVDLRQHGYLVVRVLAEDVICRLEEVLDTILAAVVFCRQPAPRS